MKRLLSLGFIIAALASFALLTAAQNSQVTLTGNIVDTSCATGRMKQENPQASIDKHTKNCSLMEKCLASGLGVYADGKFTQFDDAGKAKAKSALEASEKANGAKFKVVGKMVDGKLAVTSIEEVK